MWIYRNANLRVNTASGFDIGWLSRTSDGYDRFNTIRTYDHEADAVEAVHYLNGGAGGDDVPGALWGDIR